MMQMQIHNECEGLFFVGDWVELNRWMDAIANCHARRKMGRRLRIERGWELGMGEVTLQQRGVSAMNVS
jgi:hypothetical protein